MWCFSNFVIYYVELISLLYLGYRSLSQKQSKVYLFGRSMLNQVSRSMLRVKR